MRESVKGERGKWYVPGVQGVQGVQSEDQNISGMNRLQNDKHFY